MTTTFAFLGQFGDAIEFIFNEHESPAGGAQVGGLGEHVGPDVGAPEALRRGDGDRVRDRRSRSGSGSATSARAASSRSTPPTWAAPCPSLALIAFFVAYLGVGFTNLTLALVLLAIPPILTNTYTGVRQVDRDTVDAARGMGMTGAADRAPGRAAARAAADLRRDPDSAVNVIATATIAPLAGVITLGDPIINVNAYGDEGRLAAAIVVALLAVVTEVVARRGAARRDPAGTEARGRRPR